MDPTLTDDLIALAEILRKEQPGLLTESAVLDRLHQEAMARAGSTQHTSPYPAAEQLDRYLANRAKRSTSRHTPDVAYVDTSIHVEDFPVDPGRVADIFRSLPPHARVGSDEGGWLTITWNEPATDADRAALAAELAEEAERAEFDEWKRQRREGTG